MFHDTLPNDLLHSPRPTLAAAIWNVVPAARFEIGVSSRLASAHHRSVNIAINGGITSPCDARPAAQSYFQNLQNDLGVWVYRLHSRVDLDLSVSRQAEAIRLPRFAEFLRALACLTCRPCDLDQGAIWVWSDKKLQIEVEPWDLTNHLLDAAKIDYARFQRISKLWQAAASRLLEQPDTVALKIPVVLPTSAHERLTCRRYALPLIARWRDAMEAGHGK